MARQTSKAPTERRALSRGAASVLLIETDRRVGTLIAEFDAYGGAKPPLFVLSTELP